MGSSAVLMLAGALLVPELCDWPGTWTAVCAALCALWVLDVYDLRVSIEDGCLCVHDVGQLHLRVPLERVRELRLRSGPPGEDPPEYTGRLLVVLVDGPARSFAFHAGATATATAQRVIEEVRRHLPESGATLLPEEPCVSRS